MTTDNTPKHAPQKEAHQYRQCICENPGFPHCVCGDIEPVSKHCAQQPTTIYPDMHTLWMKHSLEFPGGQRLMRLKDFDKALHEAGSKCWISVEDVSRLPGIGVPVLLSNSSWPRSYIGALKDVALLDWIGYLDQNEVLPKEEPTHWQPLPQPPKVTK